MKLSYSNYGANIFLQIDGEASKVERLINALFNYGAIRLDSFGNEKIERTTIGGNILATLQVTKENLANVFYQMKIVSNVYQHGMNGRMAKKAARVYADNRMASMELSGRVTISDDRMTTIE